MQIWKKYWVWIVAVFLIGFFWWTRFYNIRTAFFFYGDQGRDMLVLWDWKTTGKPPLLGPQTGAIPMNQSAIYFYILYPLFLVFGASPVSSVYTIALFYIGCLAIGLYLLRGRKELQSVTLIIFFLSIIHPQYIIQTRYVWNPSFLPPLLSVAFINLFLLTEKFGFRKLFIFSISMALAVSLHFPAGAFLIASVLYICIFWKKFRVATIFSLIGFLILFNLPTLVFEARHGFLITKNLLGQEWIGTQQFTVVENIRRMAIFVFSTKIYVLDYLLLFSTLVYGTYKFWKEPRKLGGIVGFLFISSFVITFASKMAFHTHYIFGFTTLLFMLIATSRSFAKWIIVFILGIIYLNPTQILNNYVPANRTMGQMKSCFQRVCADFKEPIFVSVQADFHPYHNGPEHRFMMKQAGCDVKYIEETSQRAELMAVVLENSDFIAGQTGYNELTMFGKATEIKRYNCQANFGVVILNKK